MLGHRRNSCSMREGWRGGLLLAEVAGETVAQRLGDGLLEGALADDDHDLDRHARLELAPP
jgi:hypothetical protein